MQDLVDVLNIKTKKVVEESEEGSWQTQEEDMDGDKINEIIK